MPVYVYKCKDCEKSFEYEHGINDPHPTTCESCSGELKKVFLPVGIVFKGSGFYINDNKDKKHGNGNGNGTIKDAETTDSTKKADEKKDNSSDSSQKKSTTSEKTAKKDSGKKTDADSGKVKAKADSR